MKKDIKCIGTIMNRYNIGENTFVFSFGHVTIGYFKEETCTFVDRNGNEYGYMSDPTQMNTQVQTAYANLIELDKLVDAMEEKNLNSAIKEYENRSKDLFYCIGKIDDTHLFSVPINITTYKNYAINTYEDEYGDLEELPESTMEITSYPEGISEEVEDMILKVISGYYNLDELKTIKEYLKEDYKSLETLLDTLDIQIDEIEEENNEKKGKKKNTQKKKENTKVKVDEITDNKLDIDKIFNNVTKTLIAQDKAARRVITEIARKEMDPRKKKEAILLTGKTGVGKTELMRLIAKYLDKPFYKVDTTQLTIPGYVGKDIEEVLWDIYIKCDRDKTKTEQAIVFFDEIDKKGSSKKSDISGQGVLNLLLPFIEGSTYDACRDAKNVSEKVKIDTSNMIVVLGGAYTDVYRTDNNHRTVGFGERPKEEFYEPTTKDFIEKGLMTDEFMGRVTVINLKDLSVDDIKRVMLESDESAIKIQQEIFNKLGVKLTFTDGFTSAVAKNAYEKKTGARGLNGIIDESTWRAFGEVYSHNNLYEEVILNEDTIKDASNYQLIKRKNN